MLTQEEKRQRDRERQVRFRASLSPEQKAEMYAKRTAERSAKRAVKALAEGRTPGKPGPKALPPEEKKIATLATHARFRKKNLERRREYEAEWAKNKRAEESIAKGREPGLVGRERIYTPEEWISRRNKLNTIWRQNNPDKVKEMSDAYYSTHKEEALVRERIRRARKKGNGGTHTALDIAKLFVLQKGKCTWCLKSLGDVKPHVDHKVPLALGGSNNKSNLQLLHKKCNLSKSAKDPVSLGLENGLLAW